MALPPCFHLADSVFPRVRAVAARQLVEAGWSQTRTSQALGVSQGMVSRYLGQEPDADVLVLRMAADLVQSLRHGGDTRSVWCDLLTPGEPEASEALQDLLAAEQRLLAHRPLAIVPQIGLNLARARVGASSADQVLSYPARIVAAGDRLISPAPPAFGASRHLAGWLLRLRAHDASFGAAASVRGGPDVAAAAGHLGRPVEALRGDANDVDEPVLAAAETAAAACPGGGLALVHDPGAFGIEPCLYVGGPDALGVVDALLQINDFLVT